MIARSCLSIKKCGSLIFGALLLWVMAVGTHARSNASQVRLRLDEHLPDSLLLDRVAMLSQKLRLSSPYSGEDGPRLRVNHGPFNRFAVDIKSISSNGISEIELRYYRPSFGGSLRPVAASEFEFYTQFLRQELSPEWLKNRDDLLFSPLSKTAAYSVGAIFPEALPFYVKSGDFAQDDPEVLFMESFLFLLADAAATYLVFSPNPVRGQRVLGVSGYALTRVLGMAYANFYLKRNQILVESRYRFVRRNERRAGTQTE